MIKKDDLYYFDRLPKNIQKALQYCDQRHDSKNIYIIVDNIFRYCNTKERINEELLELKRSIETGDFSNII